ncbi:BREX-1 system phosphatase PglZ type A [Numidum massiliense]|uniref:BREX-1 system phosphatase PglZ type A n=1 Tax=Numidum massiliense TaxID=1522315 RepID=UPI0006D56BFA|nr:BREX-1 system phosphatase PglZ type A [Numidum massiliense]
MNIGQIESALADIFAQPLTDGEQRKIVFWVDRDGEFAEDVARLSLEDVKVHTLTTHNQFYTKYLLEEDDPTSAFLIYTQLELATEDNWLMDTVLYAQTFYADRVSLILSELGMDPSLRAVVKKYERFFNNKQRFRKFQAFEIEAYTEPLIETAIMSVLCNVKTPNVEAVLKTVLMDTLDDAENKYLTQFAKFFDVDVFWTYVANTYGYEREREQRSLKTLFMHLTVTAFSHAVDEKYLQDVEDFIATRNRANALVFIDHWMHHKVDDAVFNTYAAMAEQELQLARLIKQMPLEAFQEADIFPYVDRAILMYIVNGLHARLEDYEAYKALIRLRRTKHYYPQYAALYDALYYTVEMHAFHKRLGGRIPQGRAGDLYRSYVDDYYVMDTYYRKFYVAYDRESTHELMKKLQKMVEHLYTDWYMGELSTHWSQAVAADMQDEWALPGAEKQQNFYRECVSPKLQEGARVFVIVSDAFRYEAGVELSNRLNAETVGECEVTPLLGVVPSVTKLGMAALLPHRTLDFAADGRVLVDGKDTAGLENRKQIVETKAKDSIVRHASDMLTMNKAARRETFKGKKLIYLYHDTIDAMGDKAATEIYTFDAVEKAVDELYALVKMIGDDLGGTNVYITADHGFLYERGALAESDKIGNEQMAAIEAKRRYVLSPEQREVPGLLKIDLSAVVANEQGLKAYVPKAAIRFKRQGAGANFVHGGASLQEIVVPLLSFKNKRVGQKGVRAVEKVDIRLTSVTRKITNRLFHLDFFQTENAGDKVLPRTVVCYFVDEAGTVLSNEETIIGDRHSDDPSDRTFKRQFVLKQLAYDKQKAYYFIVKDTETGVIVEKIPFTINLGIVSDFDF